MKPDSRTHFRCFVFLVAVLALFLAASSQSFWIDEAITARYSAQPTFHDWTHLMVTDRGGSDPQMPLYLFWTWLWDKIFGDSEHSLRLAGWPWLAVGVAFFSWRKSAFFTLTCALSAFLWYYSDEARPYAMQAGLALALLRAAISLAGEKLEPREETFWQIVLIVSGTLLAMSHLLGMFWTAAYWGFCLFAMPRDRRLGTLHQTWPLWLFAIGLLGVTCYWYLWTITHGLRATDAGTTDLRNVIFSLYELSGLSGLGPGRLEIRDNGLAAFKPFAAPLALGLTATFALVIFGLGELLRLLGLKRGTLLLLCLSGAMVLILGIGVAKHFRVLGRHLTPLLPFILWLLAAGASRLWHLRGPVGRAVVTIWALVAAASCYEIHFAPRHAKDDYRSAAAVANAALQQNKIVWWNADYNAAWYYHVPLGPLNEPATNAAIHLATPDPRLIASLPRPDVILSTKPDVYDKQFVVQNFANHNYPLTRTFTAFKVWEK